ncbi:MAG: substrate-binding domain-containing protein [Planctomycetia bacterium]|nr:substrate-binding domain-containing protein [Planctomycetia bacterium]
MSYFQKIPEIQLFLQTDLDSQRQLLRGILRYENLHGPWNISLENEFPPKENFSPTGRIVWMGLPIPPEWWEPHVPTVILNPRDIHLANPVLASFSRFTYDTSTVGAMAAEFFLNKHAPHFAYVAYWEDVNWNRERLEGFQKKLAEKGHSCLVIRLTPPGKYSWKRECQRLGKWLQSLPKPIAIFAANDACAVRLLKACHQQSIVVPHEVMVLGVDNDEFLCQLARPSLSSIQANMEETGYRMAEHLDGLLRKKLHAGQRFFTVPSLSPPTTNLDLPKQILYSPMEIHERRSTNTLYIQDPYVAKAMEFIQINFCERIGVAEVVKIVDISRRSLEVRFRKERNRSIFDEITHWRLEKLTRLLRSTTLSQRELAPLCGFQNENYMAKTFRRHFGISMNTWRKQEAFPRS